MGNMSSLSHGSRHATWIWRNGKLTSWEEATVHVTAVGHSSTAAVFEGIKAYLSHNGSSLLVFRLDDHLCRLYQSARICRIEIPFSPGQLREAILELLAANQYREDIYIRPWAFAEGLIREQMVPAGTRCEVVIDTWPFRTGLTADRGCRAAVSSWLRAGDCSAPARIKAFSNYHAGRLALLEAKENGHDMPILLNGRLKVSEGPSACLGLVRDGEIVTPSLTSDVLSSITRATIGELAAELGTPMVEREVDRTELYVADEVFFMGTGAEVLPVIAVDGLPVRDGVAGPITRRMRTAYAAVVRGACGRHGEWLTEISLK